MKNDNKTGRPYGAGFKFAELSPKKIMICIAGALIILLMFILLIASYGGGNSHRSESYKKVKGAAGLDATIAYECTMHCEQKFNFNVYLFKDDGQQFGVFRPDKDGRVQLAAPGGDYVMLISKRFGQDKVFRQEPLALENGKMLELKLRY